MTRHSGEEEGVRRLQAIERCNEWIKGSWGVEAYDKNLVEIRHEAGMIGLFAMKDIKKGTALLRVPFEAQLSFRRSQLDVSQCSNVHSFIETVKTRYEEFVKDQMINYRGQSDLFWRNKHRLLHDVEIPMMLFVTLLLYHKEGILDAASPLSSEIGPVMTHWSTFLETWPADFSGLPLLWTPEEMENMKGTACFAYTSRVRSNVEELWDHAVLPCLELFGIPNGCDSKGNNTLYKLYQRALAAVNSRSHGSPQDGSSIELCPIFDLINGERDDKLCNVELIGLPGPKATKAFALCDIQAGRELKVSYGDIYNMSYFAKFGYLPLQDGSPVTHPMDIVTLQAPPALLPNETESLRWQYLKSKYGMTKEALGDTNFFSRPFALIGNERDLKYYRKLPQTHEWGDGKPCGQILSLMNFAGGLLVNEKTMKDIKQEGYVEPWEYGAKMIQVLDYHIDKYKTQSHEEDEILLETQSGNMRMGTMARMLERDLVLRWRHAICIRNYCYDYDSELIPPSIPHKPALLSKSCYICRTSYRVKRCTRCKSVFYCGKDCQIEHWRLGHKEECKKLISQK